MVLISFSTETHMEQIPQRNLNAINNLLVYPTPHAFKFYILPFLSSKAVIQTFEHFKILYPKLDLCKWLDYCETSIVQDLKDIKTLYYINQNKPSPFNTILYSQNSKTAIIPEVVSPNIRPNESCALLLFNQIFPFEQYQLVSQEIIWVARNSDNFFVALKTNGENFTLVARGNLYNINFNNGLECIWEIYNLKGFQKYFFMFQYFLTIPYVKYFEYVSPFLGKIFQKLKDHTWRDLSIMNVNNFFTLISFRIIWLIFCYIHAALEFQIFMFPFCTVAYFAINLPSIVVLFSPFILYIMHILFGFDIFSIFYYPI
jgi:hypothetical protein